MASHKAEQRQGLTLGAWHLGPIRPGVGPVGVLSLLRKRVRKTVDGWAATPCWTPLTTLFSSIRIGYVCSRIGL